jgi:hypothetical protein
MKNVFSPTRMLLVLLSLLGLMNWGCEKEFIPDTVELEEMLVVEGYIEAGDRPTPPLVILTRSVPFFQELNAGELNSLFVHDAEIWVESEGQKVGLQEICLSELSPDQRELLQQLTGLEIANNQLNVCLYTDLSFRMTGKIGGTYRLQINSGIHALTATTTIPDSVGLSNLRFDQPPGEPSDTLRRLLCRINDPGDIQNYYRYFTGINNQGLVSPSNSTIEDDFFDGRSFEFPLPKAEPPNADFDPETFGLYRLGDTVVVKWANIDQVQYDFWSSLESAVSNQGPFSTYTRVNSNVSGGLGVWGGLSARYYTIVVADN